MNSFLLQIRFLAALLLFCLTSSYCIAQTHPVVIGQPMPIAKNYEFLDGSAIDFSQFKGKPMVVYYGADWCAPCFRARPTALGLPKKHGDKSLVVILLMSDPEKRREANTKMATENGVLVGMSKKELCANADCRYGIAGGPWQAPKGVSAMPSAWLVDKQGVVRSYFQNVDGICFDLEPALNRVLAE
jgi:thiol-disulfide isomerase/thioredoxin